MSIIETVQPDRLRHLYVDELLDAEEIARQIGCDRSYVYTLLATHNIERPDCDWAARLKRLRAALGWTQEDLARDLGVSWGTIQRLETGKTLQPRDPLPRGVLLLERLTHQTDTAPD